MQPRLGTTGVWGNYLNPLWGKNIALKLPKMVPLWVLEGPDECELADLQARLPGLSPEHSPCSGDCRLLLHFSKTSAVLTRVPVHEAMLFFGLRSFLGFFWFFQFTCFILYWSRVDLQCCVSFRCPANWFSYTYTSVRLRCEGTWDSHAKCLPRGKSINKCGLILSAFKSAKSEYFLLCPSAMAGEYKDVSGQFLPLGVYSYIDRKSVV